MAMAYGQAYVASIAFGASDAQTVKALREAESYDGPSLVIAYSPCIEHGYDLADELDHMKLAVETGYWMLYRYDPRRLAAGGRPLQLDGKAPSRPLGDYLAFENRFSIVKRRDPDLYRKLLKAAESSLKHRRAVYEKLAEVAMPAEEIEDAAEGSAREAAE